MTAAFDKLLLWSPRIFGLALSVFLGLFALDAFSPDKSFIEALPGFVIHLVPAFLVLAIVAASWRWQWLGGVTLIALGVAYAVAVSWRLDWVAVISGPLLVTGVLFLFSWWHRSHPRVA
ncbi:MAG TPA: hypothetical protein VLD67_02335 [Vicinamibacterales bacterium]|nr:hypothetical protein [Vicinamibacterales bacterium]